MKLKLCSVYNLKYKRVEGCYVAPTVGMMIRDNSPFLAKVSPHFIEDLALYEIGEFSDDGMTFCPLPEPVLHSWEEYKNPEIDITKKDK